MSIVRRFYIVLGIMLMLVSGELSALWFTIHTLSAVRSYVAGEGLWSKAEKDAVYHLEAYGRTRNSGEYRAYQELLHVSLGDEQARVELGKSKPDWDRMYQGLLEGRNNPQDIPGMVSLFRRFGSVSYIAEATADWTKGDGLMMRLRQLGSQLHAQVDAGKPDAAIAATLSQIGGVNADLTVLEVHFSSTLGAGSRWLSDLVLKLLLTAAFCVELTGVLLTVAVTRGISRRLNAMVHASDRISQGDYGVTLDASGNDEIGRLAVSVNRMTRDIARERDRAENAARSSEASLREAERLTFLARHDSLTGLPNRPFIVDRLALAITGARQAGTSGALLFIDLDHFKRVNDTLGHTAGDRLLAMVGNRLKASLRAADAVARHGGDEFLVTVTGLPSNESAGVVARSILGALAKPFVVDLHELTVTASIGISIFPQDGEDVDTLIRAADTAMYRAKACGRNTFRFYAPPTDEFIIDDRVASLPSRF